MKLDTCAGRLLRTVVGVATSPGLLVEVAAHRTGQKAGSLRNRAAHIIRAPPFPLM
jgi:hypothetical protein